MQILDSPNAQFAQLKSRLAELEDLWAAAAILHWDQKTYMPPKGMGARGRQLATLDKIAHEKFTDGTIAQLLDDLTTYEQNLPYDSDTASLNRDESGELDSSRLRSRGESARRV
jgi:carboxypeptidase Taq